MQSLQTLRLDSIWLVWRVHALIFLYTLYLVRKFNGTFSCQVVVFLDASSYHAAAVRDKNFTKCKRYNATVKHVFT